MINATEWFDFASWRSNGDVGEKFIFAVYPPTAPFYRVFILDRSLFAQDSRDALDIGFQRMTARTQKLKRAIGMIAGRACRSNSVCIEISVLEIFRKGSSLNSYRKKNALITSIEKTLISTNQSVAYYGKSN